MTIREIEIQEQLEALYQRLEAFDEPFPSDAPFEYEVEEVEAWEGLREQIRALENELTEITKINKEEDVRFGHSLAYIIHLTNKVLKNNRRARTSPAE